jgi:hypothetical protein
VQDLLDEIDLEEESGFMVRPAVAFLLQGMAEAGQASYDGVYRAVSEDRGWRKLTRNLLLHVNAMYRTCLCVLMW